MKVECIEAVQKAIGRSITQQEARGIEEKILATQRRLAARDPKAWAAMPREGRLRAAAEAASKDLQHAAELKVTRAALTVEAHARHVPDVENAGKDGFKVIQRKLDQTDAYIKGVQHEYLQKTLDTIDYATTQDTGSLAMRGIRWISNLENPEKSLSFVREVFGKDSGDTGAKAAAKAWLESVENMRQRFNQAGGDVRKLSYGYLPQPHDSGRIRETGLSTWVREVFPMVDRSRYVSETGNPLNDAEIGKLLEEAWRTISSDGWAKVEPGQFRGEGSLANAGSQARVIHFKDAESYVTYLGKYGQGTVFDALSGHIGWMARNIGLVEQFGPNPAALFRTMHDTAKQAGGVDRVNLLMNTEDMWKTLTGELNNPESQRAARIGQGLRNVEVFGKLQGATLSAVTDVPTYFVTLGYNRLNFWQGSINLVRAFGSDARHYADVAGLVAESKISDMNRWAEGNIGQGWTARLANATMKASLLNAWTDAVRRAFSITMMAGMAKISRTPWEALDAGDRMRLETKGWTVEEWRVLQSAKLETWRNTPMLTPGAIDQATNIDANTRQRVISRYLGTLVDEAEYASLAPDLSTRTLQQGGLQKGTGKGELWRSLMLFKSFPIAMISRHWSRALSSDMTPASRMKYGSSLAVGMTMFGALATQLSSLRDGKDPLDMTTAKFWATAFTRGGGAGFLGDMLMQGQGRQGQSGASAAVGSVVGPVAGSAFELVYDVGFENIREAADGKDTHAGAEMFRWLRGHTPFVSLWYSKLVLDQAVLNDMQEFLSPGYMDRVRARAEKDWGSTYWWAPGEDAPERAPELSKAMGRP